MAFPKVNALARLLVVPAETLMLPWLDATVAEAVTTEPLRPKETLFELLRVKAERLLEVVPADRFICAEAVIRVEPDIPKVTLLLFEKTTVPLVAVCVPAAIAPGAVLWE